MIAAWMVYASSVTALLLCAGIALEWVMRALGAPTRVVWIATMTIATMLSASALAHRTTDAAAPTHTGPATDATVASPAVRAQRGATDVTTTLAETGARVTGAGFVQSSIISLRVTLAAWRALTALDQARFDRYNAVIGVASAAASLLCIAYFVFGAMRLRQLERGFEPRIIDGYPVLVSRDVGPALLGVTRPRIVVPGWVLHLPPTERRVILAHENAHRDALDPLVMIGGIALCALMPWSIALWAMFARLRVALEVDCDGRVLRHSAETDTARGYGALLLRVYEQSSRVPFARIAFVERHSALETRIVRLTRRAPRIMSMSSVAALAMTALTIGAAYALPIPLAGAAAHVRSDRVEPRSALATNALTRTSRDEATRADSLAGVSSSGGSAVTRALPPIAVAERRATSLSTLNRELLRVADLFPVSAHVRSTGDTECGFGGRYSELCSIDGDVVIRAVDSIHVIIGVLDGDARSSSDPVDHLFLITAKELTGLPSRVLLPGHVEFRDATLRVVDVTRQQPDLLIVAGQHGDRELTARGGVKYDNLSMSHYSRGTLTLAMIPLLVRSPTCEPLDHLCYTIDGVTVGFP